MRSFILGVLVSGGIFLAMGWAFVRTSVAPAVPAATSAVRMGTPLRLQDVTLDRVFRYQFVVGNFTTSPVVVPFPAGVGIAVTSIRAPAANFVTYKVSVNGGAPEDFKTDAQFGGELRIDPPLIVPPGGTLAIGDNGNIAGSHAVAVGGYYVYTGEV